MRRREFVALISGAAIALAAGAARSAPAAHHIGVLAQDLQPGLMDAFRTGFHDLGYSEGTDVEIELRNAAGHSDRLAGMIQNLLARDVDVILAVNTPAALAAKKATSKVPIVMMRVADR